jgi:hypothetical protein
MPAHTSKQMNVLKGRDQFKLFKLVEEDYNSSGFTDEEFAFHASTILKVPVTTGNVQGARIALDVKSNKLVKVEKNREVKKMTVLGRLEILEHRLHELLIELGKPGLKE